MYHNSEKVTLKAFANWSPGLLQPWIYRHPMNGNAEGVGYRAQQPTRELFQSLDIIEETGVPGLKQPWAPISERFQRI